MPDTYDPTDGSSIFPIVESSGQPGQENRYTVSACNVVYFTYPDQVVIDEPIETPDCCCNQDIANELLPYVGIELPSSGQLEVNVTDNTASPVVINRIDAISNGVLFAEVQGQEGQNSNAAIPLCSIFSYTFD